MDQESEKQFLLQQLQESAHCREETVDSFNELQEMYLQLLKKYAQAKNYIDQLRLYNKKFSCSDPNTNLKTKELHYKTQSAPNLHMKYYSDRSNSLNSMISINEIDHASHNTNECAYEVPDVLKNRQIKSDSALPSCKYSFQEVMPSTGIPSSDTCNGSPGDVWNGFSEFLHFNEPDADVITPFISTGNELEEGSLDFDKSAEKSFTKISESKNSPFLHNSTVQKNMICHSETTKENHSEITVDSCGASTQKICIPKSHLWANTQDKVCINLRYNFNINEDNGKANLPYQQTPVHMAENETDTKYSIPESTLIVDHTRVVESSPVSNKGKISTDSSYGHLDSADYIDTSSSEELMPDKSPKYINRRHHRRNHTRKLSTKASSLVQNSNMNDMGNLKYETRNFQNDKHYSLCSLGDHELKLRTHSLCDRHKKKPPSSKTQRKCSLCDCDLACSTKQDKGRPHPPSLKSSSGISSQDSVLVSDSGIYSSNKCGSFKSPDRTESRRATKSLKASRSVSIDRHFVNPSEIQELCSKCNNCYIQEKKHLNDTLDLAIHLAQGLQKQSAELLL